LVRESFEKAEFYVHQLHKYRLHATLEQGDWIHSTIQNKYRN
jgi:hypothetical protein